MAKTTKTVASACEERDRVGGLLNSEERSGSRFLAEGCKPDSEATEQAKQIEQAEERERAVECGCRDEQHLQSEEKEQK